jgi:hypothetical protein
VIRTPVAVTGHEAPVSGAAPELLPPTAPASHEMWLAPLLELPVDAPLLDPPLLDPAPLLEVLLDPAPPSELPPGLPLSGPLPLPELPPLLDVPPLLPDPNPASASEPRVVAREEQAAMTKSPSDRLTGNE